MLSLLLETESNFFWDVGINVIAGIIGTGILAAITSLIAIQKKKFYKALFNDDMALTKREKYFIKHYVKHNLTLEYSADEDARVKEGEELSFKTFLKQTLKNEEVKIVFIAGSAGVGKSTLMYNLAARCREKLKKGDTANLVNYGILFYKLSKRQSIETILQHIEGTISHNQKQYTLFLDGLDEITDLQSKDGKAILSNLIDGLRNNNDASQSVKKIFISLRPEIFESGFKDIKNCLSTLEKLGDNSTVLYKVCNFNEKQILAMQRIAKYDKDKKTSHKTRKQNLQKLKLIIKNNPKSVFTYPLILSWADDILSEYKNIEKLKYISWYEALNAVVTKELEREYKIYSSRETFAKDKIEEGDFITKAEVFLAKVALDMALGEGYVYRDDAPTEDGENRYELSGDNNGDRYFTDRLLKYVEWSEQEDNDKPHYEFIHNTIFWKVLADVVLDPQTNQKVRKEIIFKYKKVTPLLQYCRQGLWSSYENEVFPYSDLEYMRIADNGGADKVIKCRIKESGAPLEIILSCFYEFNEIEVDDPIRRFDFSQIKEFVENRKIDFSNRPISDLSILNSFGWDSFDILDCSNTSIINADDIPCFVKTINFGWCKSLKSVTVPNGVEEIGDGAFIKCASLESVTIGKGVTIIGEQAFAGTALKSITIPDSVKEIGECAFIKCSSLESVTIGKGVATIGEQAFVGTALKSITIPYNVKEIGDGAFIKCASLESVTIGKGVTIIGEYAFNGCTALKSITIPDNVKEIGKSAFVKCASLESVKIGSGVTVIGYQAFAATALKSITIPHNVKEIGDGAFIKCASLESVTIGKGVTIIGEYAFADTALKSITIPDNVKEIGVLAFADCAALTSINYDGNMEQWAGIKKGEDWLRGNNKCVIRCTDGDITENQ